MTSSGLRALILATWGASLAARGAEVCPIPQKSTNIASIIMACDYSRTRVETEPELIKQGLYKSLSALNGIQSDTKYFEYLNANLGVAPVNVCGGSFVTKQGIIAKMKQAIGSDAQYVFLSISAHGQYVPVFEKGKFKGLNWAVTLPLSFTPAHCATYNAALSKQIEALGVAGAEKSIAQKTDFRMAAARFATTCGDTYLTFDEIGGVMGGRSAVVLADSCYSGGICKTANREKMMVAASAVPRRKSIEYAQLTKPQADEMEKKFSAHTPDETTAITTIIDFYKLYVEHFPESAIPDANAQLVKDTNAIDAELAREGSGGSPFLDQLIAASRKQGNVFDEAKVRAAFKKHSEIPKRIDRDWDAYLKAPERFMGELNSFLYDRDLASLDEDGNGTVSFKEYFADLKGNEATTPGMPPVFVGSGCAAALMNHPLFNLSRALALPAELRSHEFGPKKLLPAE